MTLVVRLIFCLLLASAQPLKAQETGDSVIEGFPDFRQEILEILSGATSRIWISTEYLTDGDIVAALYIAKYRKIDVQVLLGRAKANAYMSRLHYLKTQNIPAFLKPDSLKLPRKTAILADDTLYFADGDLDFLTRAKQFHVAMASHTDRDSFIAAYTAALNQKLPAHAHQLPLVGRPAKPSSFAPKKPFPFGPQETRDTRHKDPIGVYHYKRSSDPRPVDVPSKLPKDLKWDRQTVRDKPVMITPVLPVPHADGG